jgi:hypothetical protein
LALRRRGLDISVCVDLPAGKVIVMTKWRPPVPLMVSWLALLALLH